MPSTNPYGQPIGRALPDWQPPPAPEPVTLPGRFCRIEPLSAVHHADALFDQIARDNDPSSWTYLAYGPFDSPAAYRAWLEQAQASRDPLYFAIIDGKSDQPVGVCSYLRIDPANGVIEIGHLYFTHRLQRTPAATEAMALMMGHAFALGYRRYEWKCDALNAPSRRAAERLGFRFEGIFRQAVVYKNRNRDTAWFSILDSEWPDLATAYARWLAADNFDANGRQIRPLAAFMPAHSDAEVRS